MAVMMPREKWTDDLLDELNKKVDGGFARVEKKVDDGFARVDKKIDDGLARVDKKIDDGLARVDADMRELRGEVKDLKSEMNARFERLNLTMLAGVIAIVAALIGIKAV